MMRKPFGIGEWYHCYSRGVDKRRTFLSVADYERFQQMMYLTNSTKPVHMIELKSKSRNEIFSLERPASLVAIAAYALMPNHFHMLLKEVRHGGISRFMQKLGTAYTMYFNVKQERAGGLFVKPFRSKHIADDRYLKRAIQYIHLNPADFLDPEWKIGRSKDLDRLEKQLKNYQFSSLADYSRYLRPEATILDKEEMDTFSDEMPFSKIFADAAKYNEILGKNFK